MRWIAIALTCAALWGVFVDPIIAAFTPIILALAAVSVAFIYSTRNSQ